MSPLSDLLFVIIFPCHTPTADDQQLPYSKYMKTFAFFPLIEARSAVIISGMISALCTVKSYKNTARKYKTRCIDVIRYGPEPNKCLCLDVPAFTAVEGRLLRL